MSELVPEVTGGTAILNLGDGSQVIVHIPASQWRLMALAEGGAFALYFEPEPGDVPSVTRLAEGGAQFRLAEPEDGIWRPGR